MSDTQTLTDFSCLDEKSVKDLLDQATAWHIDRRGVLWLIVSGEKIRVGKADERQLHGEPFDPDPTHLL